MVCSPPVTGRFEIVGLVTAARFTVGVGVSVEVGTADVSAGVAVAPS